MKRVSTFAILKSLLNPLLKKSLPKIALFALLLMATACEGRVAASGITLVTPLPPDGVVVTASPIAVAELVNGKLSGSTPCFLRFDSWMRAKLRAMILYNLPRCMRGAACAMASPYRII